MSYAKYNVYNPFAPHPLLPPSKGMKDMMKPPSSSVSTHTLARYKDAVMPALPSPTLTLTKPGGSRHRRTHRKGGKSHRITRKTHRKGGKSRRHGRKTRRH